ncbi:kinase-like domain-containing protein [Mycena amicta]|nr:kinase-like domain-containing protein [Mycena amicta]
MSLTASVSLPKLPEHLAQDRGLTAAVENFQIVLRFSEKFADSEVQRLIECYTGPLVAEATRVMKQRCTGSYPIARGGFNIVRSVPLSPILTHDCKLLPCFSFEDGTDLLARLRLSGPSDQLASYSSDVRAHQFLSEVATIAFVRKHTSIPVPDIFYSDFNANNAVGTPFMLMQRVALPIPGESLGTAWDSMSHEQREVVVREVAHIEAQLLQAPLSMIGSLIDDDGTVGPLAPSSTYPHSLADPYLARSHHRKVIDRDRWMLQRTKWRNINGGIDDMPVAYAIRWFSLLLAAIHAVPSEQFDDPAHFTLYHDDLSLSNILVSPSGNVVGLVDWQGAQDNNLFNDLQERYALLEIQQDIIFQEIGLYLGSYGLSLGDLLHIAFYSHSVISSRAHLDRIWSLLDTRRGSSPFCR